MKIGCLLSVREKATRLPKKVLLDVAGRSITECLLKRLTMAKEVDSIILSTSTHPDDRILTDIAKESGFEYFRGNLEDKLDRYYHTAIEYDLDGVIIVDGDDLLCFPECIDLLARFLREDEYDCLYFDGLPLGAASTALTTAALKKVLSLKCEKDTEVWGGYFIGSGFFRTKKIQTENELWRHPEMRLTMDYQEDYEFLLAVISEMSNRLDFTSNELMDMLVNKKPHLCDINRHAQMRYMNHIRKAAPVKFKELV